MEEQITPKRHGFITFWLWLGIVFGILGFVGLIVATSQVNTVPNPLNYDSLDEFEHALWNYEHAGALSFLYISSAILCLVDACASFILLQQKKLGFKLRVGAAVLSVILALIYGLSVAETSSIGLAIGSAVAAAIGAAIGIGILYAILNIRKDGVPYWSQLQ